jgi:hypothetical protein
LALDIPEEPLPLANENGTALRAPWAWRIAHHLGTPMPAEAGAERREDSAGPITIFPRTATLVNLTPQPGGQQVTDHAPLQV